MPGPRLLLAALVVAIVVGPDAGRAAAQSSPVDGPWHGQIDVAGTTLPFAVVFADQTGTLHATIDIQGAKGLPLQAVSATATHVHFELPAGLGLATFDGALAGAAISGAFTQGAAKGTFTLTRGAMPAPAPAASGPPPPYHVEDVTFTHGNVTLAGTLTTPDGDGPFPAIVMVTGSGAQNRDEEIFGFKIFAAIADALTRHGVAVLRYDDRGVGGSTGQNAASTSGDFAGDALAGLALLATRPHVDARRLGVFGHSEGADVAAIAAAQSPQVAFIVMMAGAAISGEDTLAYQQAHGLALAGATPAEVATEQAAWRKVAADVKSHASETTLAADIRAQIGAQYDARPVDARSALGDRTQFIDAAMTTARAQIESPWMRYFIGFDPAPILEQVHCPVLALFGGKDTQVPVALNQPALEAAFAKGGNHRVTVKVFPDANHLFQAAHSGEFSEYATLPKAFVPGFLDEIAGWIQGLRVP